MEKSIRQSIPESNNAKDFLKSIGDKFKIFDKAQKGHYLSLLEKTKYDGLGGVREHIMKLVHYCNKLRSMKVDLGEDYLIWRVLESLPSQFDVLKTSYNTQKGEWTIDEMISIVTQEEESMKKEKPQSVHFTSSSGAENRRRYHKGKLHSEIENAGKAPEHLQPKKNIYKGNCKYCKKPGHKVDDCYRLKKKLEREGVNKPENAE